MRPAHFFLLFSVAMQARGRDEAEVVRLGGPRRDGFSARGEPLMGTPKQAKGAGRLQEGNEAPGLHLLRQEQRCEKQRTFTAKAPGGCGLKTSGCVSTSTSTSW